MLLREMDTEHFKDDHPLILNEERSSNHNDEALDDEEEEELLFLPRQIQNHPFHPPHTLFLTRRSRRHRCNSCRKPCVDLFFRCDLCDFDLDPDCAELMPTIKYHQAHPNHFLNLFNNNSFLASDYHQVCSVCRTKCKGLVLRCVPCQFNLHVSCLPRTAKHKYHRHFLTLTTSIVRDVNSDEFYCDACEEERNPIEPVYNCATCHFVSHIGCVASKETAYQQESNDAAAPSEKLGSSVSTDDRFLLKLDEDIARLRLDVEGKVKYLKKLKNDVNTLTTKLRALENERAQYANR